MRAPGPVGMFRLLLPLCVIGLYVFLMPRTAGAQAVLPSDWVDDECFDVTGNTVCDVEGFADITELTDATTIDTWVATSINDFTILDAGYFASVDGTLIDQAGKLGDSCSGFDIGTGDASCSMDDPIVYNAHGYVQDDVYELVGYHDLDDGLGDTIPVGQSQVDVPLGAPTITGVNPPNYGFVGTSGTVTIQGIDLVDPFFIAASVSPSSGTGLLVAAQSVSGDPFGTEYLTVAYSISQCASTGPRFIVVSNQFGSDTGDWQFTVGDPPPLITSVSPGAWQAGNTYSVGIYGMGFGTNPGVTIVGQGVTYTVNSTGDTQIAVTVTVASNAPQQTVTITVQSNGYCGSGFQAAYPGEPSTSTYGVPVAPVAPTPQIQLYQQNITSTKAMIVGQQIALRAVVTLPIGVTISSQNWSIPPGNAVGGYTNGSGSAPCLTVANCLAPDGTGGKVLALPASSGDSGTNCGPSTPPTYYSCFTFYWVDAGNGRQITYTYTANTGGVASATVTFNIDGPNGAGVQITPNQVIVLPPPNSTQQYRSSPLLINGGNGPGMKFMVTNNYLPQGGSYRWVQLISSDVTKFIGSRGPFSSNGIVGAPEIDHAYPYGFEPDGSRNGTVTTTNLTDDTSQDSPFTPLIDFYGEMARSFKATMYAMWVPASAAGCNAGAVCTIPVPQGSVSWQWQGDAINTLRVMNSQDAQHVIYIFPSWIKNYGLQTNSGFQKGGALPQWRINYN